MELFNFISELSHFHQQCYLDSNISTNISRKVSQLGSFVASFQEKNLKLSWISNALKMSLGIKIIRISLNPALHPALRDNLFQSLRSARYHMCYDDHQELMNLVDQEWTQKFIRSIFKPLHIDFWSKFWFIVWNLNQSHHFLFRTLSDQKEPMIKNGWKNWARELWNHFHSISRPKISL